MTIKRTALLATLAAAAVSLSACGGGKEEAPPAPEMNTIEEPVAPAENYTEVPVEAPPAPRIDNTTVSEVAPPPPELTADEQTQEYADATGMTARVSRGDGNETGEPAQ